MHICGLDLAALGSSPAPLVCSVAPPPHQSPRRHCGRSCYVSRGASRIGEGLALPDGPWSRAAVPNDERQHKLPARPAANQYAQLRTWDAADISDNTLYGRDLPRALRAIRARVLLMPGETDLYFRVADNAAELPFLVQAKLRPIPSIWGHRAGNPATNPDDARFVRDAVRDWLAR